MSKKKIVRTVYKPMIWLNDYYRIVFVSKLTWFFLFKLINFTSLYFIFIGAIQAFTCNRNIKSGVLNFSPLFHRGSGMNAVVGAAGPFPDARFSFLTSVKTQKNRVRQTACDDVSSCLRANRRVAAITPPRLSYPDSLLMSLRLILSFRTNYYCFSPAEYAKPVMRLKSSIFSSILSAILWIFFQ